MSLIAIHDEKDDVISIVFTKEEALALMKEHPTWTLRYIGRIWP